jgi:hypothetical protein
VVAQCSDGEQAVVATTSLDAGLDRSLFVERSAVTLLIGPEDRLNPTEVDIVP